MAISYDNGVLDYGVVEHPQYLKDGGASSGVYKFNTPDGGVQDGYFLNCTGSSQGGDYGWVLVGRYASDCRTTVNTTLDSVRGMDDVSTSGTSKWSADWGSFYPEEVRFLGHNNAADILGNRTTDWIYRVQNVNQEGTSIRHYRLWEWFLNANHGDPWTTDTISFRNQSIDGSKQGVRVKGARDGRGRWDNKNLTSIRIADNSGANYMRPAGFTQATSSMWYYHATQDAKWAVSATDTTCGQDTDSSALFGWDDNHSGHYDENTGNRGQNANDRSWTNSCVLVFMR